MEIERGRLRANGINFAVLAAGRRNRPVALLLHGFPEGKESWEPQLKALAEAGWRAVAPDLRGYGGTDAPAGVEAYAMPHLVADIEGLVNALGVEAVPRGPRRSGGGRPAVRTWTSLSIPHPVALARASGLDGGSNPDPDQRVRSSYVGLFQRTGRAEEVMLEKDAERLRSMFLLGPNPEAVPEETIAHFVHGMQRPGRLTAGLNYYRANLKPAAYAAYPPCPKPIKPPTTLVWGDEDPALGRKAVEETASMVKAPYRLVVLQGAGHWLQFERPDEVSRAIVENLSAVAGREN